MDSRSFEARSRWYVNVASSEQPLTIQGHGCSSCTRSWVLPSKNASRSASGSRTMRGWRWLWSRVSAKCTVLDGLFQGACCNLRLDYCCIQLGVCRSKYKVGRQGHEILERLPGRLREEGVFPSHGVAGGALNHVKLPTLHCTLIRSCTCEQDLEFSAQ